MREMRLHFFATANVLRFLLRDVLSARIQLFFADLLSSPR